MRIEEAILFVLARRNGGLKTDQIADIINRERLFVCKDGHPVSSAFIVNVEHLAATFHLAEADAEGIAPHVVQLLEELNASTPRGLCVER